MLRYGTIPIDPPLILAPMAGVTDRDFRLIVRRIGGVGVVTMEFIASKAIVNGNKKTRELMYFSPEERPLSIQIYGSDVETMREAALVVEELGADIRMMRETGCDGVMIGRGATRNPWIFRQIAARMSGSSFTEPTLADRRDLILDHFRLVAEREPSLNAMHKLRKFTGWYTHGLPH